MNREKVICTVILAVLTTAPGLVAWLRDRSHFERHRILYTHVIPWLIIIAGLLIFRFFFKT